MWLQSTLSTSILSRVLGSAHSYEVWEWIHDYFHKQTRATVCQLRTQLRSMTLWPQLDALVLVADQGDFQFSGFGWKPDHALGAY